MDEKVGTCSRCSKTIYCKSGFLNGTILKEGKLICFQSEENDIEKGVCPPLR
ncbi:hypothetical protein [Alkalihalobacterium elongatum]|uniref:hypothetical protein n=1 Tax=Alkalihalobacterium elongatum TaxID=2675466 RepID=UPI001C1F74D3|nr:hypothetical protein [Alkalihalobacterium elongatum]